MPFCKSWCDNAGEADLHKSNLKSVPKRYRIRQPKFGCLIDNLKKKENVCGFKFKFKTLSLLSDSCLTLLSLFGLRYAQKLSSWVAVLLIVRYPRDKP